MFVSFEYFVLSGTGLCYEMIIRSEKFYRLRVCLIVCDVETSTTRRPRPECGS
jgi:hypothetical protein